MSKQQQVTNGELVMALPSIKVAVMACTRQFVKDSGQEGASPRAIKMANYVAGGGFGCKSKTVRAMMELAIGEKLPNINVVPGPMVCLCRTGTATMLSVDSAPFITVNAPTERTRLTLVGCGGSKAENQSLSNFDTGTEEDIYVWFSMISTLLTRAPNQGMHNNSALKALYLRWDEWEQSDAG